jgi:hypothetical protein
MPGCFSSQIGFVFAAKVDRGEVGTGQQAQAGNWQDTQHAGCEEMSCNRFLTTKRATLTDVTLRIEQRSAIVDASLLDIQVNQLFYQG